jgi:hypothetical protein
MIVLTYTKNDVEDNLCQWSYQSVAELLNDDCVLWHEDLQQIYDGIRQNDADIDVIICEIEDEGNQYDWTLYMTNAISEQDFCDYWNLYTEEWCSPEGIAPVWRASVESNVEVA